MRIEEEKRLAVLDNSIGTKIRNRVDWHRERVGYDKVSVVSKLQQVRVFKEGYQKTKTSEITQL